MRLSDHSRPVFVAMALSLAAGLAAMALKKRKIIALKKNKILDGVAIGIIQINIER
ncbi:MAG: hypothetical protein H0V82_10960 [Candidatus Protochlamydia sp.]|nr:hypothetical protein [Candidatus Protochlamydia sp.]